MKAADILRDSANMLGDKYRDDWQYSLLSSRHDGNLIQERLKQDWVVVRDGISGSTDNESFVLIGRQKPPDEQPKPVL